MTARSHTRTHRAAKRKARRRLAALQPPRPPVDRLPRFPRMLLCVPSLSAPANPCTCTTGAAVRAAIDGTPVPPCPAHVKESTHDHLT